VKNSQLKKWEVPMSYGYLRAKGWCQADPHKEAIYNVPKLQEYDF
jgi:hypothetical protein